jgi:lambda family phage portal protein
MSAAPIPRPNFLDRAISFISPRWGERRLASRLRFDVLSEYRGAEMSRLRSGWALGRTNTTPASYSLQLLRNRSRDLNRNDPLAHGVTDTLGINIVGQGLRPQCRLRADRLGISEDKARALQRQAEAVWDYWGTLADSGNRLSINELQFLALRKVVEDGEVLALPVMATEPWRGAVKRAVEMLETDRLATWGASQKTGTGNLTGIEVGQRGEPIRYWISPVDYQNQIAGAYNLTPPVAIEARDSQGRPKVLHIFRTARPGQLRGVPYFAPVINYFKDLADYLEAEVVAAKVAACISVFVVKTDPMFASMGTIDPNASNHKPVENFEPGMVPYLNLGEDIRVVDPKRGGETFNAFVEGMLRIIGASLGLPYELLMKDFSKTNYSSARAALLEGRRMFSTWRGWFAAKFCQPLWELVLEEAYLRGLFPAPNFYQYQAEYCRTAWVGGAWGWVDPTKEVEASKLGLDWCLTTYADEAAAQGQDWEELLEQRKREEDYIKQLGLVIPEARAKAVAQAETAPAPDQPGGGQ